MVGELVEQAEEIPAFSVIHSDGTPRSRDDLLGHPTVIWFFTVAGTPG